MVTQLRASDGQEVGTYDVAGNPFAVAFDGANVWVANYSHHVLSKL